MREPTSQAPNAQLAQRLREGSSFGARSMLGWLMVLASVVPFLVLWLAIRDTTSWLSRLDRNVATALNDAVQGSPLLVSALHVVTELAGTSTTVLVVTLITGFVAVQHRWRLALFTATAGIGLALLIPVTKALIGRARPIVDVPVSETPSNAGYPSGHAMTAVVLWGMVVLVVLPAVSRAVRPRLIAGVVALVLVIGVTRLALGVHYLTDVLAGWALGIAWLAAMVTAFRTWPKAPHTERPLDPLNAGPADVIDVEHPKAAPAEVGGRSFVYLAGAAVTLGAVLTVVGLLVTTTWADTWLGRWDRQVVASMASVRTAAVNDVAAVISALSGTTTVIAVALAAGALTLAATRSWRPMLFVALAIVGEVLLYLVISQIVGRTRPAVPDLTTGLPTGASWPSGHAAAATVLYGALAALLYRYASSTLGWTAAAAAAVITVAVSTSRVLQAAHHPTDVIAGALLGLTWLLACIHWLLPAPSSTCFRPTQPPGRGVAAGDPMAGSGRISASTPLPLEASSNEANMRARSTALVTKPQPHGQAHRPLTLSGSHHRIGPSPATTRQEGDDGQRPHGQARLIQVLCILDGLSPWPSPARHTLTAPYGRPCLLSSGVS